MTVRVALLAAIGVAGACLAHAPASAASFNCDQAKLPDEVAVCANPALSSLDSEMGGLWYAYSRVPMLMGGNGNRQDEAQAFLATRRACKSNLGCLTAAYSARIAALRREIDGAMAQFGKSVYGG